MIGQGLQISNNDLDLSSALQIIANTVVCVYLQYPPETKHQGVFANLGTPDWHVQLESLVVLKTHAENLPILASQNSNARMTHLEEQVILVTA